ncbi:hypothetical protein [Mycobacteroides abscessus]|uniref:hypothetical protein n=1 Tax=Mycobacteroides abscessus TaxID=36809 RepID=UPI003013E0AD
MTTESRAASEDVPQHLLNALDAVTTAVTKAHHNRREDEQTEHDVIGLAFLAMRQLGLSDHYIARALGQPTAQLRAYAKAVRQRPSRFQTATAPAALSKPELLWHAARYAASTCIESETITDSRDVIIANNIDGIEYSLPVATLDTSDPRRRDDHDVTFSRIVTALRRAHAILPPYRVAAADAFRLR